MPEDLNISPLYMRPKTPWWAEYAIPLVVTDMLFTLQSVQLTWTRWGSEPPKALNATPKDSSVSTDKADTSAENQENRTGKWWHRYAICASTLATGTAVCVGIMVFRSRIVNVLDILPPNPREKIKTCRLVFACPHYKRHKGATVPLRTSFLQENPFNPESALAFRISGAYGMWSLSLDKACIWGKPLSRDAVRKIIIEGWRNAGGIVSPALAAKYPEQEQHSNWKTGPASEVAPKVAGKKTKKSRSNSRTPR
ncbi:hypothetical protein FISHEDRAFT_75858 [Fistulina hepatica ATCC 64428]|uniref:Uncharacterized protein n=1 Tax=Fistulina hepatica ATCC 64428 TaxID=1128425 RepID=A0A0D7A7V8_9AGAR|nr:hypothetical protein FISHEDRAFT_75858 [Fistulina hepatica ATCC 64428]